MGDDHPRGVAVRGQEQLHTALELGVVEHLRRQVEGAVVLGLVEGLTHRVGVLQRLGRLLQQPGLGGVILLHQRLIALLGGDLLRDECEDLRLYGGQFVDGRGDPVELGGEFVDTVQGVEQRPERRTERDVVTVRFPVEIVADRPEEVVDVGDLVAQVVHGVDGLVEHPGLLVGGIAELLLGDVLAIEQVDRRADLADLIQQVLRLRLLEGQVLDLGGTLRAHLEAQRAVVQRGAQRPGDGLHHGHPGSAEDLLGDPLQDDHVGRGTQILVGFDHQHLGVEPGRREMPFGRRVAHLGRCPVRHVMPGVVAGLVPGQCQQTDQGYRDRGHQDGPRPAHDGGPDTPPPAGPHGALGVEQADVAAHGDDGGRQGQRGHQGDQHAQAGRNAQALEVRRAGEAQAEHRRGDGKPRPDDDVRRGAVHRVVGRQPVLAGLARLLVAAQQEDGVVGGGGDRQQRQQVGGIRRQRDDADVAEEGDQPAGGGHLDGDGQQGEQRGGDGPVDDEQHQRDHAEGQAGDLEVSALPHRELVGDQRGRAADVGLHPRRGRGVGHDLADRGHRLVGLAAAGVAVQVDLDEGGLAVVALRTRRGQRVTPEVLHVLDVGGVGLHPRHQGVAETVGGLAQRLIALDDQGDQAVGVVLAERRSDPLGRDQRRGVLGALGDVVDPPDLFQRRDQGVARRRQRQPDDGDRDGQPPDQARDEGGGSVGGAHRHPAHPDLSRQ